MNIMAHKKRMAEQEILLIENCLPKNVFTGITLCKGKDDNFNYMTHPDKTKSQEALQRFLRLRKDLGVDHFYLPRLQHEDNCWYVNKGDFHNLLEVDAIFLDHSEFRKGSVIGLGSPTADCPTIIGSDGNYTFIIHSGKSGCELNISGNLIKNFAKNGLNPEGVKVVVWGGICPNCYKIEKDYDKVLEGYVKNRHFDMRSLIKDQIMQAGIKTDNITIFGECSYESSRLFSYRQTRTMNRNLIFVLATI